MGNCNKKPSNSTRRRVKPDNLETIDSSCPLQTTSRYFDRAEQLQKDIEPHRVKLTEHSLYKNIIDEQAMRTFMQAHVFCVWDFMSIVKVLQQRLTCVDLPWAPTENPTVRRLINDIIMEEESDVDQNGNPASHCELYQQAMVRANANPELFQKFLKIIRETGNVNKAYPVLPESLKYIQEFLEFTFDTIQNKPLHVIASVFTFGRENLIPEMFTALIKDMDKSLHDKIDLSAYVYYVDRHIELDGDHHGPMSLEMVAELCGDDDKKWAEAKEYALKALESREKLWTAILRHIETDRTKISYRQRAENLQKEIEPTRVRLTEHPLYKNIKDENSMRTFMQAHVFCVWDFMSIVKSLQRQLTCVQVPWVPSEFPKMRRLINDIIMEEETDVDENGKAASHCELYQQAMVKAKANPELFQQFLQEVLKNKKVADGYKVLPTQLKYIQEFLEFTFDLIENKPIHIVAAVFTYARENLIPEMFTALIKDMDKTLHDKIDLSSYVYYVDRHIELDGEEHGPMSFEMVGELCGDDEQKWKEAKEHSIKALESREKLWTSILKHIETDRSVNVS